MKEEVEGEERKDTKVMMCESSGSVHKMWVGLSRGLTSTFVRQNKQRGSMA